MERRFLKNKFWENNLNVDILKYFFIPTKGQLCFENNLVMFAINVDL